MTREETNLNPLESAGLNEQVRTISEMLSYKRPHLSKSERKFINRFIRPLGAEPDEFGNMVLQVGSNPTILWSAHTDSVHRTPGRQRVVLGGGHFKLSASEKNSSCLGADNAAGVWLLTELIKAKVPGLYVFHRGEEGGCVGSKKLAAKKPKMLDGITSAIAFDRRGTKSIITHQMSRRTCSDAFATSLGAIMALGHEPDDGGSYTDTNSYADFIPECTNVSVGYAGEHSMMETLNLGYLLLLRASLVSAKFDTLEIARDPKVEEYSDWPLWGGTDYWSGSTYRRPSTGPGTWRRGQNGGWARVDDDDRQPSMFRRPSFRDNREDDLDQCRDLLDLVHEFPDEVADFLEQMGVDPQYLADCIAQAHGA